MLSRRRLLCGSAGAGLALTALGADSPATRPMTDRPNVLWIVSEDNNPFLGCYGDSLARTPTLDQLASEGVLYENCFSSAPVCAPSRFTLISGVYATACGPAHHMRAQGRIPRGPRGLRGFPAYLREAGYYCTNNAKTDYNGSWRPKRWPGAGSRIRPCPYSSSAWAMPTRASGFRRSMPWTTLARWHSPRCPPSGRPRHAVTAIGGATRR